MKDTNKNFIYNVAYQMLIYLFPLITIPYISRVLGVQNIGVQAYTYSITNMIMLLCMLGISTYGNREIAKNRGDLQALSRTFLSIYYVQFGWTGIVTLFYVIIVHIGNMDYKNIFYIQIINIISVFFDVTWFYFGIEKFKTVLIRNFFVKLVSFLLVILLVNGSEDLDIYILLNASCILISQLYLFLNLKRFIILQKVKIKDVLPRLKSIFLLFLPVLSYSIYRIMDKTMLGSMGSVTELGYYESAEKIVNIPISIIVALGTVMLPRMSYIFANKTSDYKNQINYSIKLALLLATMMSLMLMLVSREVTVILFGDEFLNSASVMQLLSITIIISAWSSVVRTQYLIPNNKDNVYVLSTIVAAGINLILNVVLIKRYGAIGVSFATIVAELSVCVFQIYKTHNELDYGKYARYLFTYLFKHGVIVWSIYMLTSEIASELLRVGVQVIACGGVFYLLNYKFIMYEFFGIKKGGSDEN